MSAFLYSRLSYTTERSVTIPLCEGISSSTETAASIFRPQKSSRYAATKTFHAALCKQRAMVAVRSRRYFISRTNKTIPRFYDSKLF